MKYKICYFGSYSLNPNTFPRNSIIQKSMRLVGMNVIDCHAEGRIFIRTIELVKNFFKSYPYDCIFVGVMGHYDVLMAKILSSICRIPLYFDMYTSLYDTAVFDRGVIKKNSIKSWYYKIIDIIACRAADVVILDTNTHIEYISKILKIPKAKFRCLYIGTRTEIFNVKGIVAKKEFIVQYHGHFIPLHGMDKIVKAAELLKDEKIIFRFIGSGQKLKEIRSYIQEKSISNIEFLPTHSYFELAEISREASIILAGPFGESCKAVNVIPNKVYESISLGIPTIVADTPAIRELFNEADCYFASDKSPRAIADAILKIKSHYKQALKIASHGAIHVASDFSYDNNGHAIESIIRRDFFSQRSYN